MRKLLMITALVLVAGLMVVPAALAQEEDDVTVQEGPPLTASPPLRLLRRLSTMATAARRRLSRVAVAGRSPRLAG